MNNKNFLFSITVTEVIILLFFLLALLTTFKINEKKQELVRANEKLETLKNKNKELETQNNALKELIPKLVNDKEKMALFDELVNVQTYLNKIVNLEKELALLKKKLENFQSQKNLEEVNSNLTEQIKNKKDLLKKMSALENDNDIKKLQEKLENVNNLQNQNNKLVMEVKEIKKLLDAEKKISENRLNQNIDLIDENHNIKGQVQYLNKKLNSKNGGNGVPPCWVNKENKIEYLFYIEINENNLDIKVHKNVQEQRIKKIPNINKLDKEVMSLVEFTNLTYPIFLNSKKNQCRHYVLIKDNAKSKKSFKEKLFGIENHFYKYVLRK